MSGGSYDYIYQRIQEFMDVFPIKDDPRRMALHDVLPLVITAMHDVEWVDSGDFGVGGEHEAIDALLTGLGVDPELTRKAAAYDRLISLFEAVAVSDTEKGVSKLPGVEKHVLRVCILAESGIMGRLVDWMGQLADDGEICGQLYMDRLGHGINGVAVTRRA